MIPYAVLRRAVGAYGDVVLAQLGTLFLQSAVLVGMRLRDGNIYEPDKSLIPEDSMRLRQQLRTHWQEARSLPGGAGDTMRQLESSAQASESSLARLEWDDSLQLASMAVALLPGDPLARVCFFANLFRHGRIAEARAQLTAIGDPAQYKSDIRARILWNTACIREYDSDISGATFLARHALQLECMNRSYRRDYLSFAIASNDGQTVRRALDTLKLLAPPAAMARDVRGFLRRPAARVGRVLHGDPSMVQTIDHALEGALC